MDNNKISHWFAQLFNSTLIIYIAVFMLAAFIVDRQENLRHTNLAVLSRIMPPFEHLIAVQEGTASADPKRFKDYLLYFTKVHDYVPKFLETDMWLGYCHYYLGNRSEAEKEFKSAQANFPSFFWINYDLGVLYLKNGDWKSAQEYFIQALKANPEASVSMVSLSLVYSHVLSEAKLTPKDLAQRLLASHQDLQRILLLMEQGNNNKNTQAVLEQLTRSDSLRLRMF